MPNQYGARGVQLCATAAGPATAAATFARVSVRAKRNTQAAAARGVPSPSCRSAQTTLEKALRDRGAHGQSRSRTDCRPRTIHTHAHTRTPTNPHSHTYTQTRTDTHQHTYTPARLMRTRVRTRFFLFFRSFLFYSRAPRHLCFGRSGARVLSRALSLSLSFSLIVRKAHGARVALCTAYRYVAYVCIRAPGSADISRPKSSVAVKQVQIIIILLYTFDAFDAPTDGTSIRVSYQ